ncbi:MAG: heme exporter protein CcmD [Alphaproteobacteria bacterium]
MDTIGNALDLGGYGIYVWPAFATAAAVLGWMAISTLRRLRINERILDRLRHARAKAAGPGGAEAPAEAPEDEGTDP